MLLKAYCSYLQQCLWLTCLLFVALMIFVLMTTVPGCMEENLEKLDVEFDSTGTNIESFTLISTNGESLSHITNQFTLVRLRM